MTRHFKTVDYEAALDQTVSLREALPASHLARFVVELVAQLDLTGLYAHYAPRGGAAYAPDVLLGLLFYGYASGVFSARKIEKATYESLPFRFVAGGLHPDHDTLAHFRKTFLAEIKALFVQILLLAQTAGYFQLGNISLDGSKVPANASKRQAVSYKRLLELQAALQAEVEELFALADQADRQALPEELDVPHEIALREERLKRLAEAKQVLEARAQERQAAEQAEYEAKLRERAEKAQRSGRKPGGRPPTPPSAAVPQDKDQYNFTDPESRIMKSASSAGFEQAYNAQVAVDQASFLIVACSLSNHPNDKAEAEPTLAALPAALGTPPAAALDNGFWSEQNLAALAKRHIEAYIATGREPHHLSWQERFAAEPAPPAEDASPQVKMAYKLRTEIGQAIYRLRKCTVEPVIGIIKAVLGFRQFALRGEAAADGEWVLVCLAFNLKRLHTLDRMRTWAGA
jgi:transposase